MLENFLEYNLAGEFGIRTGVMYRHFFKRFLDFWLSLIALICISPILLVVTIWLHFANKGTGVFFTQERPGKDGKIFKVIKFKTMTDECDMEGNLLLYDTFGKYLIFSKY